MIREPKTMAELHKIREEHYELTKNKKLTRVIEEIAQETEAILKRYNLKVIRQRAIKEKLPSKIV
uniref:Uncharacterized protein n=1 Tax=candidate division WOR-3 bacterium TaxID=2052148 RepID=A0A7C4XM69_UNCW3